MPYFSSSTITNFATSPGLPGAMGVTDLNGDGYPDFVISFLYWPPQNIALPIQVFYGGPGGTLTNVTATVFPNGAPTDVHPRELIFGDFNGDRRTDFVIADTGYDSPPYPGAQNRLVLNSSGTSLVDASASLPAANDYTHSVASADVDGDGDLDLFFGNIGGLLQIGPRILLNNGAGAFSISSNVLPAAIANLGEKFTTSVFLDADRDGDQDLFLGSDGGGQSRLLLNDGHGAFTVGAVIPAGLYGNSASVLVDSQALDVNGDGVLDLFLVETQANPSYVGTRFQILIGDGHGGFVDESSTRILAQPTTSAWTWWGYWVDLNRDGFLDLFSSNDSGSYLNDGQGRLYPITALPNVTSGPTIPIDLNGDGWVDFIQAYNAGGSTISLAVRLRVPDGITTSTGTSASEAVLGDDGPDTLIGLAGNDLLDGGSGDDILRGGAGADQLNGGSGSDTASYSDATSGVTANLSNSLANAGDAAGDVYRSIENLRGSAFADTLTGDAGDNMLVGGAGADVLNGGAGQDRVSYADATAAVTAILGAPAGNTGDAAGDTYANIEILQGSAFGDTLSISGFASANGVEGLAGNDTITGGANADYLFGGDGNDTLEGQAGADFMDGGAGSDTVSYANAGAGGVTVFLGGNQFNSGEATGDIYFSIENITGSAGADLLGGNDLENVITGGDGNDWLIGQGSVDRLTGGPGNDVLDGGAGGDILDGGAGVDVAFYRTSTEGITASLSGFGGTGDAAGDTYTNVENIWGSDFTDVLTGSTGGGQVYGFAGADVLTGLAGSDVFYGGLGEDTITTGDGADDIFFLRYDGADAEGGDTILDFSHGVDHITVSRFWFGFGGIPGPAASLTATNADFLTSGAATSSRPTFFWNDSTYHLDFDPDGTGAAPAVLLAILDYRATLTLSDIWTA